MKDLHKVNIQQLYSFWKNLSVALLLIIILQVVGIFLAPLYTIVAALLGILVLYAIIYRDKTSQHPTYMLICYGLMMSFINFTVVTLVINLLYEWGVITNFDEEFIIFHGPHISVILMAPICCIVLTVSYLLRRTLRRKFDHRFNIRTDTFIKGKLGAILTRESRHQILLLIGLFALISVIQWSYYVFVYNKGYAPTDRDLYVFFWLSTGIYVGYEIYLFVHNYSLNMDLKESGDIITPGELNVMAPKTYYRCYVICDDKMFLSFDCKDAENPDHNVLDTPFFFSESGIPMPEENVKRMIEKETGVENGELRFLYGFQAPGLERHSVLRYFYFLDGKPEDYPTLQLPRGEWKTYNEINKVFRNRPHSMASFLVADTARIITITRTAAIFDENGYRKMKIHNYVPTFNLVDMRSSDLDYQSEKWIEVSKFNEDVPFFRIRRWFRRNRTFTFSIV